MTICPGCEGCGQRGIIIRTRLWSSTLNIYYELFVCPLLVKSNFHCHKSTNVTKALNIFGGRSSEGVQCGQMEYNNQKIVPWGNKVNTIHSLVWFVQLFKCLVKNNFKSINFWSLTSEGDHWGQRGCNIFKNKDFGLWIHG